MANLHRVEGLITDVTADGTITNVLVEPVANEWGASFVGFNTCAVYSIRFAKYYNCAHFPAKPCTEPIFVHEAKNQANNNVYLGTF